MSTNNINNRLLQKLIDGNLTEKERFSLEKNALDDSLLFEAIEGLSESTANHNRHIESIIEKIKEKQKEKKMLKLMWPIAAAASLLLLFSIGIMLTQDNSSALSTEQNAIAALEEIDSEEDDNSNEIAVDENKPFQSEKLAQKVTEKLNVAPEAPAQSATTITPNAIAEASKETSPKIITIPSVENESVEEVGFSVKIEEAKENENPTDNVIMDSKTEPPPTQPTEVPSRAISKKLNLNLAENAAPSSASGMDLSKRKSINADQAIGFDSQPELTVFISTKYENAYAEKVDVQGLEFLITLIEGKNVTKVEQVSGNKDLGIKIIPFIKEFKEWKLLNRKGELQFTYIFNSK